ncbi:hypothetical protein [Nonomuraea sp. NPDC049784]|uniref:hypothetical protein n=1 Tax=Nonomuraea sp. NPDC049784 TaxID=3154361 RepID=UPI0033C23AB2
MPWVRVDDQFPVNRKVRRLSDKAFRLYVSALCWCNANLTDGRIAESEITYVSDVRSPKRYANELVCAGLWEQNDAENGGGWTVHDYLEYQSSAEKIRADREAKRARQERWLDKKRAERDTGGDASQDATDDASKDDAPLPSHPIPKTNTSSQSSIPPYQVGRSIDDDDDDLRQVDEMVMRLLAPLAAQPITADYAAWVRKTILDKGRGRIQNKTAYVKRALEKDPRPYLPQGQTETPAPAAGRCPTHHQDLPCRGCAADAKARKDEA